MTLDAVVLGNFGAIVTAALRSPSYLSELLFLWLWMPPSSLSNAAVSAALDFAILGFLVLLFPRFLGAVVLVSDINVSAVLDAAVHALLMLPFLRL